MRRTPVILWLVVTLLAGTSPPARAWLPDGSPVCAAPGDQIGLVGTQAWWNAIITTTASLELVWEDGRPGGVGLYLGSVNTAGATEYPVGATPTARSAPALAQLERECGLQGGCRDIAVVWVDERHAGRRELWADRVHQPWAADGVPVCLVSAVQREAAIATSDDLFGRSTETVVAWTDGRDFMPDIYVQRLDASGERMWDTSGVLLSLPGVLSEEYAPRIVTGSAPGRVLVSWVDERDFPAHPSIFVQSLERTGERTPGWPVGGIRVQTQHPWHHRLLPGGFVVWDELISGAGYRVRATRILPAGMFDPAWGDSGVAVTPVVGELTLADAVLDEGGGLLVSWFDVVGRSITNTPSTALKLQRLTSAGSPAPGWGTDGTLIAGFPPELGGGRLAAQPDGGAIVTWTGPAGADDGVLAQRVTGDGSRHAAWPEHGVVLCGAPGTQTSPVIAALEGGAAVAWIDGRSGTGRDLYAQFVTSTGVSGLADIAAGRVTALRLGPPTPNPSRGPVAFSLELPAGGEVRAEVLDLAGRRVRALAGGTRPAGRGTLGWDGLDDAGRLAPPGLYLVRVATPWGEARGRLVRLD